MNKQKDISDNKTIDDYDMLKIAQSIVEYDIIYNNLHNDDISKPLEIINQIIYGENLKVLIKIPSNSVHLVYLDPPFFSGSDYQVERKNGKHKQIIKFEDEWDCNNNEYVIRMYQRLKELHRILKPGGIMCLHCDRHAMAWLKIISDKIFGNRYYQTTIVWQREKKSFGAKSNKIFPEMTDYIFVYSKIGGKIAYNIQYTPHTKEFINEFENSDNDPNGKYVWQYMTGADSLPSEKDLKLNKESEIKFLRQIKSGAYQYKRYWENITRGRKFKEGMKAGKPMTNLFTDINRLTRTNYPTQKPEKLLERIILSFSNKGDVILDPFCGGGTTLEAAIENKRNFIGIDQSPVAANMSAERVSKYDIKPIIPIREKTEMDDVNLMTPWIFQEWGIDKVHGITTNPNPGKASGGDGGIDGYVGFEELKRLDSFMEEEKDKNIRIKWNNTPISVEMTISNKDSVDSFVGAIKALNKNIKNGIFIALGYTHTKEKIVKYEDIEILLLTAEDLCKVDRYSLS